MLLDISMVGPRGSGKTSLLAAMYHEINPLLAESSLKLVTADRTGLTQRYLDAAQSDLENISTGLYDVPPGVPNTDDVRTLQFALRDAATDREHLKLRFTDYPGEYLFPQGFEGLDRTSADHAQVWRRFHRSSAVLVAIDTPALMWREGKLHDRFNRPAEVTARLDEWSRARGRKSLVIFCPLKCEKWVQTPAGRREVELAVRQSYRDAIDHFLALQRGPAMFFMPVQTVGSLHHQTFRLDGPEPVSVFRGAPGGHYEPRWVENPLKALLETATGMVVRREALLLWLMRSNRRLKRQRAAWLQRPFDASVTRWR